MSSSRTKGAHPATARELFNALLHLAQPPAPSLASGAVRDERVRPGLGQLPGDQSAAAEGHLWEPVPQFEKELEAGQGKQGLWDVESELGQGHIENQGTDAKGGMDVTGEKEGEAGGENAWRRNIVNLGGVFWLSRNA